MASSAKAKELENLRVYPTAEQIIMYSDLRMKGQDIISEGGLLLGVEEHGEVPLTAKVIAVGCDVDQDIIKVGDICLLPKQSMNNVPDPRIIDGSLDKDSPERLTMFSTHYKNICIVYTL